MYNVYMYCIICTLYTHVHVHVHVHVELRDNKAKQYNNTRDNSFFPKKNELPQVGFKPTTLCSLDDMYIVYNVCVYTVPKCTMYVQCMCISVQDDLI